LSVSCSCRVRESPGPLGLSRHGNLYITRSVSEGPRFASL
jgi:hypothetical protein